MKKWVFFVSLVVGLALWSGTAGFVSAMNGSIWVAVQGPQDGEPPEELVLEIGDKAWSGYGGVAAVESVQPLRVRLVGRASCRSYADFIAPADSNSVIRFAPDGSVRVEDWTGRGMDAGPALSERARSSCTSTSADSPPPARDDGTFTTLVLAAVLGGVVAILGIGAIALARSRGNP